MFEILSFSLLIVCPLVNSLQAIVNIRGGTINGNVKFTQGFGKVLIQGTITGLPPGQHGFHVHQFGDLSNGCTSTGAHFNPFNTQHGGPLAFIRHVGDLGNIVADATGKASISFEDDRIRLYGFTDIIGRAVVVHAGVDDLGLGGNADSLTTGNAGARLGCGVIGRL